MNIILCVVPLIFNINIDSFTTGIMWNFCFRRADLNKIMPDILTVIGQTPLVKLNNIPKAYGIKCEMCEYKLYIMKRLFAQLACLIPNSLTQKHNGE